VQLVFDDPTTSPRVPRTVEQWLELRELEMGRYLTFDIGCVIVSLSRCLAAGLNPPYAAVRDGRMPLPSVTVRDADRYIRVFRLPLTFARVVFRLLVQGSGRSSTAPRPPLPSIVTFSAEPIPCIILDRVDDPDRC